MRLYKASKFHITIKTNTVIRSKRYSQDVAGTPSIIYGWIRYCTYNFLSVYKIVSYYVFLGNPKLYCKFVVMRFFQKRLNEGS